MDSQRIKKKKTWNLDMNRNWIGRRNDALFDSLCMTDLNRMESARDVSSRNMRKQIARVEKIGPH